MKIESVAIDKLELDAHNARLHSQENLDAIMGSLRQFGQRKPIVVTSENVVVAGNGTIRAARLLEWSKIDVVRVPEDWTEEQITAFALADNRTAELATWDDEILGVHLKELQEADFLIDQIGFIQTEPKEDNEDTNSMTWDERYEVVVECSNEIEQEELLNRFSKEGYKVRAIVI
jgi:ParB-like chromosome segregation protein Spo0J